VELTQNLLYIIQHRSTQRDFSFVIYQSTAYWSGAYPKFIIYHPTPNISFNCLLEWSVPKIYYISSNADRSDSRFSFVIYQSTAYWSGAYPKFNIYHPMPIGATRAFRLLYIIQCRSERLVLFVCYLSFNCLLEWSVPKICYISSNADRSDLRFSFVIYHPTPIGATCAFRLLYIIQLPTGSEVLLKPVFFKHAAEVRNSPNFLNIKN
jgi:hypothetical protein